MYQTSQEYKDLMKRPVRNQSFMKVQLGLINQDAQQSAELQDQEKYNGFSDPTSLYSQHTVKRYATYEKNMFRADGGMYFLPRSENDYSKDGITSKNLFAGTFSVKFVFGCGKSDIKGLTIRFGENYPTKFTIMTDSGEVNQYNNANATFETDSVFENTESIELSIIEMRFPNNRVRIDYIQFGLGLEYDNEWIKEASSTTSLSAINDDLPQSEFSITLNNDNQIFNVDNPASEINFLESGQKINVLMGYKLDSGSVEWMQMHSLYVHEWSADDEQATIKAVDVLQFMSDEYHKGEYYTDGISLYDLAEQVFADAGITPDEYDIDTYLKKVKVHNPLPNVTHKEALQIIANAGRCVLDYDRYGRIRIHSLFIPECETSSNGTTYYSDVSSVDVQNEKDVFATYEKNGWKADGKSLFLKRVGVLNSGYVSAAISKDDGTFTQNPVITRTLEAKYKSYGLFIEFGNILPKKFIIRTYADNVLNDTLVISSGIVQEFEIQYDFKEYDKMEIEFTEMPSNSRVHVNYISIGSETAYKIEYDDLYSTPIGTQLDKVKNIKVARYLYSKGNTLDELVSETFTYDGNSSIYYVSEPSYGYVASIQNGKSGQSASIVSSGAYYVEIALSGVSVGAEVSISVRGYKYNISTAYTVQSVNNRGNDKEWNNPLISDLEHSRELAEWVKDEILSSVNTQRKYRQTINTDGTISLEDLTAYAQKGTVYGAKEIIEERKALNDIHANKIVSLSEVSLVTEEGYFVDAKAVKELYDMITPVSYAQSMFHIQPFYNVSAFSAYKIGREVHFNVSLNAKSGTTLIANNLYGINSEAIPAELRPTVTTHIQCVGCSQSWGNGVAAMSYVDTTGVIYFSTPAVRDFYKFHGVWIARS